jgi:hypothetical protein
VPVAALVLLSPWAAAIGIPALGAVAATIVGRRRAEAVRRELRLPPPPPTRARVRLALVTVFVALLAVSAAQPALTRDRHAQARRDVQVLFVLDVSRSMAASSRLRAPTRLDRAAAAAERLRTAIPTVSAGIASLTDRVLPNLFPVPDRAGFARVLAQGVAIENPPPRSSAVRATSYTALEQIPGSGYFAPGLRSRIVVVLTDGESVPVQTGEIASAFAAQPGYHLLFIRFWRPGEAIYDADGHAESAYRPDPSGQAVLDTLASAVQGTAYEEDAVSAAAGRLRSLSGSGPVTESATVVRTQTPLAPFSAALALLAAVGLAGVSLGGRPGVRWSG